MRKIFFLSLIIYSYSCKKTENSYIQHSTTDTIVNQIWMNKNLNVITYSNGDTIPEVTDPLKWAGLSTGAWCYYNNDPANDTLFGKLYNWYAVNDPRGLAPQGWHIPSDSEWTLLMNYLGGDFQASGAMKNIGTNYWYPPNSGATNSSGFNAFPGGNRNFNGSFYNFGHYCNFWSSTQYSTTNAWDRNLSYDSTGVIHYNNNKGSGFSCRCIKN